MVEDFSCYRSCALISLVLFQSIQTQDTTLMCFLICIITFIITVIISNVDFVSFSGGIWDLYFVSVSTVGRCVHYRVIILLVFFQFPC